MFKIFAAASLLWFSASIVHAASAKPLEALIKEAGETGRATTAGAEQSQFAGIPKGLPGKGLEVDEKLSEDGATHNFIVYYRDGKPYALLFAQMFRRAKTEEGLFLACDARGKFNSCYRTIGRDDERGNPIEGSGQTLLFSPKDKKMSAALKHELDFWLKGKYRKTPDLTPR